DTSLIPPFDWWETLAPLDAFVFLFQRMTTPLSFIPRLDLGSRSRKTLRNSSCQGGFNEDAPDASTLFNRRFCARNGTSTGFDEEPVGRIHSRRHQAQSLYGLR